MNKKLKQRIETKSYTLDLSNAIMPKDWPKSIPTLLDLETGKFGKDFDIVVKDDNWYQDLKDFVIKSNRYNLVVDVPIGLNINSLPIGSKVFNENKEVIALGRDRLVYEQKKALEVKELEDKLNSLRKIYPKIKDEYLIDFDETQELLLKGNRPFTNGVNIYNTFSDVFLSGGGSTYSDKKVASLGAYNSLLDFEALDQTLGLFKFEEVKILSEELKSLSCLSPIYKLIQTVVDRLVVKEENSSRAKIKIY